MLAYCSLLPTQLVAISVQYESQGLTPGVGAAVVAAGAPEIGSGVIETGAP